MKKKVKKIASILFALCLSVCLLTACGGNDKAAENSSEPKTETEITASAKDKQDDSQKEEFEKADKGIDETEETSKAAGNKKETSSSNSGSSASKSTSSANRSQNSGSNSSASQFSQPSTNKPSTSSNSGNSGSASKSSPPAQESKPSQPTQESKPAGTQPSEPAHTHTWVWATHTETTPEQSHIVETKKYVCNGCGAQFDNAHDVGTHVVNDFWDDCENYTYKVVDSQKVVDVPEQTVTVKDYQYCSECGARK